MLEKLATGPHREPLAAELSQLVDRHFCDAYILLFMLGRRVLLIY